MQNQAKFSYLGTGIPRQERQISNTNKLILPKLSALGKADLRSCLSCKFQFKPNNAELYCDQCSLWLYIYRNTQKTKKLLQRTFQYRGLHHG